MKNKNLLILLIAVSLVALSGGCLDTPKPHANIDYIVIIETLENVTIYLPVPLDLPSNTVSDLVSSIKVDEKENDEIKIFFDVVDTEHGSALRVITNGNVTLKATSDNEFLQKHPQIPVGSFYSPSNEPLFFNLSMKINENNIVQNYSHWAYLYTTNNEATIKVREVLVISVDAGEELWLSLKDNSSKSGSFTLKPGWQLVKFKHLIGVH